MRFAEVFRRIIIEPMRGRLPDKKKFADPEELRAQIARDTASANRFFTRLRLFRPIRHLVTSRLS